VIRFARPGDIPALLEIQQKVSDALPHPDGIGFNRDHAAQVMVNAMQARNACLIVARTFLYWGAGDGPLLLDAFAAWGREMGATRVRADALDYRTKATARAYRRNGFRPVEHVYERVL